MPRMSRRNVMRGGAWKCRPKLKLKKYLEVPKEDNIYIDQDLTPADWMGKAQVFIKYTDENKDLQSKYKNILTARELATDKCAPPQTQDECLKTVVIAPPIPQDKGAPPVSPPGTMNTLLHPCEWLEVHSQSSKGGRRRASGRVSRRRRSAGRSARRVTRRRRSVGRSARRRRSGARVTRRRRRRRSSRR